MLKMALLDCAINEKCCSVDGGRGICPLFSSPPRGIWQLESPHPWEFAIQGNGNSWGWGQGRGGGGLGAAGIDWCINFMISVIKWSYVLIPLFLGQMPFFTCDKCNVNKQNLLFLLISIRFIQFCSWPQCRRGPRLNIDQFPKCVHAKGASF